MADFVVPAAVAVFTWWFTTGVILYLDRLPQATFGCSLLVATVLALVGFAGLAATSSETTPAGAYLAFTFAVLIWGHQEMCFLMGYITGPRRVACPPGSRGYRRFVYATQVMIHHELALLAVGAAVLAVSWGGTNHVGPWTYLILWAMRLSAKLNLFLGVRNLGEEFLPPHLEYLKGYFTRRSMNLLFPVSITLSTLLAVGLVQAAQAATSTFEITTYSLLAALTILAILEHWFMVLPLPTAALWRWAMRSESTMDSQPAERRTAR